MIHMYMHINLNLGIVLLCVKYPPIQESSVLGTQVPMCMCVMESFHCMAFQSFSLSSHLSSFMQTNIAVDSQQLDNEIKAVMMVRTFT